MLGVRLDKATETRLEKLCKATHRTKSFYAKKAITEFLDDREDYMMGIAVLEKQEKTISLEMLEKELENRD